MKQFVLGLIVAALAWWGYGKWTGGEVFAQLGGGRVSAPGGESADVPGSGGAGATMQDVLGAAQPAAPDAASGGGPARSSGELAGGERAGDLEALIAKIERRDAAAIAEGWLVLAGGRVGEGRAALVEALRARGADFSAQLEALGPHNGFLRSSEGRAAARAAIAAVASLPDDEAIRAGTQLIRRMAGGRIELEDKEWRLVVDEARGQHRVRVDRWLCDPTNVAGARTYTVKSGDSLDRIASRFRRQKVMVEPGVIAALNRISNPNSIRAGQTLKIPVEPISAELQKRSYALMVFVGDQLFRLYWVGHGANDHTPVTDFVVTAKHARPEWTAPNGRVYPYGHPDNVLGEYFIKFGHPQYTGFGAHGTPEEETIGTQSSMGCIRMFAPDIAELFRLLPRGAEVRIRADGPR